MPTPEQIQQLDADILRNMNAAQAAANVLAESKPPEEKPPETKPINGRQCPKCGTFVEIVQVADDQHLPGYYCNKTGCGWADINANMAPRLRSYLDLLPASMADLIKIAPLNETARAHVHSIIGLPVPKSCKTTANIIDWIETVDIPKPKGHVPFKWAPILHQRPPQNEFQFPVHYTYREFGVCHYRVNVEGEEDYRLSQADLETLAGDSNSWDDFVNRVRRHLVEMCMEDPPETSSGENEYEYFDYDENDSDEHQADMSIRRLKDNLQVWMQEHLPGATEHFDE